MKLSTINLKDSVLWNGVQTTQISAGASLELIEVLRCVVATPVDPKRKTMMIPLENIKSFEPLTAEMEKAQAAAAEALVKAKADAKQAEFAAKAAKKTALKGVTKMIKDPVTGAVVEVET